MRIPKKKVTARATALALGLGLVGVVLTALPAFAATPTVTSVSPTSGGRGTPVTLTGTNFNTPATTAVTIGGVAAPFVLVSDTTITATIPCAAVTGAASFVVNNGATNTDTAGDDFTVLAATAPTITSFTPTSGPVGTVVTITGTNFCGATQVLFNTTPATAVTVNSATSITATVPTGATSGAIHVTTPVLPAATSATSFGVGAAPTITSFSPTTGSAGTSVTITGTNLLGVTGVKFNGVTATFTTSTATSVTATVPSGATTGKITVTTAVGTGTSATDFTVSAAAITRSLSFGFQPHSRVAGQVNVSGTKACSSLVPVVIQKQKGGGWKWVDTTATTKQGSYKTYIPPSKGNFRAKINKITLANGVVCGGNTSNVVHVH